MLAPFGDSYVPIRSQLGESPNWRPDQEDLVYVDIFAGNVHTFSPTTGVTETQHFDGLVGAAVPAADGSLIVAVDRRLLRVDRRGVVHTEWEVEADLPDNRFNDCKCDPAGRVWAGTMSRAKVVGSANLYLLDTHGTLTVSIPGVTLSNGVGWSPDARSMYYIDSTTRRLDVLDFDVRDSSVSNRRTLVRFEPDVGLPDGLTVDAEGGIWVALASGGAIRRYLPDATLDRTVELPVSHPTSLAFGGPDLRTLFVTTASFALSGEELEAEPLAGTVLALDVGVGGLPAGLYGG
ncbi:SMP-30/gluconolactonase/LRE family protein [Rhodococcus jostii]|uniref:SMP-30/gluconolactonase/LRE family protein n=1 Tax=Rhodococcus jostii TaxID=132919 RepID=UPI00363CF5E6